MKTKFRFIEFVSTPTIQNCWACLNNRSREPLGGVEWYKPWKQYIFNASETAVFSADCLRDIAAFMEAAPKP